MTNRLHAQEEVLARQGPVQTGGDLLAMTIRGNASLSRLDLKDADAQFLVPKHPHFALKDKKTPLTAEEKASRLVPIDIVLIYGKDGENRAPVQVKGREVKRKSTTNHQFQLSLSLGKKLATEMRLEDNLTFLVENCGDTENGKDCFKVIIPEGNKKAKASTKYIFFFFFFFFRKCFFLLFLFPFFIN